MHPCPPRDQFLQLLARQLSAPESAALEAHVEGCAACQQALEELTGDRFLQERLHDPGSEFPALSPGDVLRRLKEQAPPRPDSRPGSPSDPGSPRPEKDASPGPPVACADWPQVPGYEVLEELARGGRVWFTRPGRSS
jgi:anti-sigma factor RsiW